MNLNYSWELGAGSWELGAGSWVLGAGCWAMGEEGTEGWRDRAKGRSGELFSETVYSEAKQTE
jgi:hypothetical protein